MKTLLRWFLVCLTVVAAINSICYAASTATPVCIASGYQHDPRAIAVGGGDIIIVWADGRDPANTCLYAQRIDSLGRGLWGIQCVRVSSIGSDSRSIGFSMISNGHGGAIIAFSVLQGYYTHLTYVQQVLSDGSLLWGNEGIRLDYDSSDGFSFGSEAPALTTDGADGAIIGWVHSAYYAEYSSGVKLLKTAYQRIDKDGLLRWSLPFVSPPSEGVEQDEHSAIVSDGNGGAFAIYSSYNPILGVVGVQRQRIDSGGNFLWSDSGTFLTTLAHWADPNYAFSFVNAISHQPGKVIFSWTEYTDSTKQTVNSHVKAMDVNYTDLWEANGIPGTASPNASWSLHAAGDGLGGALYVFNDTSLGKLIVQRVDSGGQPQWAAGGVDVAAWELGGGFIAPDGRGGAYVSWQDFWGNAAPYFLQYVDAEGKKKWGENGIMITGVNYNGCPNYVADGLGNAVVVYANSIDSDPQGIYAQKIDSRGNLIDQHIAGFASQSARNWCLLSIPVSIDGDSTVAQLLPDATSQAFTYTGGYKMESKLQTGYGYFVKFPSPRSISLIGTTVEQNTINVVKGWNLIGSISSPVPVASITCNPDSLFATGLYGYDAGYMAATTIQACHGYWIKFNGAGTITLRAAGTQPASKNRLRLVPDGELPPPVPGINLTEKNLPSEFTLDQNYPNPFNPVTTITYTLPRESHVRLSIYNVLGQEVWILVDEFEQPGYKSLQFDANKLSSGLYFYRIVAGTFTDVKKMMLLK
jgi:hypothetical protein